jgi:hypothetical protein
VKPKNEDAEVIEVDVGGEKKKIVMAPGRATMVFRQCLYSHLFKVLCTGTCVLHTALDRFVPIFLMYLFLCMVWN